MHAPPFAGGDAAFEAAGFYLFCAIVVYPVDRGNN